MRLRLSNLIHSPVGIALLSQLLCAEAFTGLTQSRFGLSNKVHDAYDGDFYRSAESTAIFAKKKKGKAPPVANLDFDMFDDDEPLSKKDQMKAQKKAAKEAKRRQRKRSKTMPHQQMLRLLHWPLWMDWILMMNQ